MWWHHLFSAPTRRHHWTQEGKSKVRSPSAWSRAPGRQTHFRMNYSERAWDLFISVFFPPFCKRYFIPEAEGPLQAHLPTPTYISSYCILRKWHPSGPGKLCYTHFAYILYITQGAGWRRELCCAYLFWLLFMQVWLNEGTVGIISISDVNIKLLI